MTVKITVFTLFPEIIGDFCSRSLLGRALERGIWTLEIVNIRNYAEDRYGRVDDTPMGGGRGMVMRADVLGRAIESNVESGDGSKIYYMSPRGRPLNQQVVAEIAKFEKIALLCGRYEGVDQRVIDEYGIEELSIGDFVMMGGELPTLALIESVMRYRGGVLRSESIEEDSFGAARDNNYRNLLEYPLYTRPRLWKTREVPEVLLSGNHREIENWKLTEAKNITEKRRPDLYRKYLEELSNETV
ncbi:MAG: tRNA (guanosine(37)-N1)-methyltransferase TrmD [Rickettsiales bacterium]|nr:tRNA (guanosine(37)-N1)-methyltransferase TrmD [Rickettsiales bacterium]